jgi:hypothetical protein
MVVVARRRCVFVCVCFFECSSGLGVVIVVVAAAAYVLRKVKAISIASLSRGAKQASLSCTEGFHFLRALLPADWFCGGEPKEQAALWV